MDTHLKDRVGREMDMLAHRQVDIWSSGDSAAVALLAFSCDGMHL